jgi:large subunit ribosomal protein L23
MPTNFKKLNKKNLAPKGGHVKVAKKATTSQVLSLSSVLLRPRITEKAGDKAMNHNVYVFDVDPRTTKFHIKKAVQEMYKVSAMKIATVTIRPKTVVVRGKKGQTRGGKKAYVYLKKGDKIDFI